MERYTLKLEGDALQVERYTVQVERYTLKLESDALMLERYALKVELYGLKPTDANHYFFGA